MLSTKTKQKVIEKFKLDERDTGSSEVQIALLTEEMKSLTQHLKTNPKDTHSRRGLLRMVAKRKSLLNYLKKEDEKRYSDIAKKIGLKS
ncbi:MAG: 30S ribosomal protein S15 [Candidatus Niyogibacteria bacterium]|nr:30S ribosomal protein S15 [Candidatus Niyogibacteria bacterium]